ncbi:MAG: hypothetical protein AAF752_07090 [Bacteroidota bacterium]
MSLLFAGVGTISMAVGLIYMIVRAFQESLLWGVACILLGPLIFVFAVLYWDEAKAGLIAFAAGLTVLLIGGSFS